MPSPKGEGRVRCATIINNPFSGQFSSLRKEMKKTRHSTILSPISGDNRMHLPDALRGFALLGIYVVNLHYLSGYKYFPAKDFSTYSLDSILLSAVEIIAEGKFYSLFSFLFGLGFAIQMLRLSEKEIPFLKLYLRRLGILFLFGIFHTFLWQGDILSIYAIAALMLIPFRKLSNTVILISAAGFLLLPLLFYYMMLSTNSQAGISLIKTGELLMKRWELPPPAGIVTCTDFKTFFLAKIPAACIRYADVLFSSRFFKLWGMFLLGFYFGRNKIFKNPAAHKKLFRNILIGCGSVGIIFSIISINYRESLSAYPLSLNGLYAAVVYAFSVHPLSLAYMAGFALLYLKSEKSKLLSLMSYAGRMALTNYLMQTIAGIIVFYKIGLGLGPVSPAVYIPFAIIIFILQMLYSKWWLTRFSHGPVEWLWRKGIYGK